MPGIDALKREVKTYREVAYNLYEQLEADPAQIKNLLAISMDNRQAKENPVRIQEAMFFPEVYSWHDQVVAGAELDKIDWTVPLKGYDAFVPYNKVNIGRPSSVHKLDRIVPRLPEAWMRKQVAEIMNVFRVNGLSYDGQNFFDTDHTHPASKGTYSNVTTPNWSTTSAPTFAELVSCMDEVRARFVTNLALDAEVIDGSKFANSLVVIAHNATTWAMFEQLRVAQLVPSSTEPNLWKGGFQLLLDNKPTSGQTDYVEVVLALPGGPRPAFFVLDAEPVLDAWETNQVPNGYVAVGLTEGIFGVKAGYPQTAIQVRPT